MLKVSGLNRKRLIIAFGIVCALLVILCFRVGYWQIIKADAMTEKAVEQQTRDTPVEAKRGTIYDRNGAELAVSGSSYSVWARPANVKSGSTEEKKQAALDTCVFSPFNHTRYGCGGSENTCNKRAVACQDIKGY